MGTWISTSVASAGTSSVNVDSQIGFRVSITVDVSCSLVPTLTTTKASEVPVASAAAMPRASTMLAMSSSLDEPWSRISGVRGSVFEARIEGGGWG